VTILANFLPAFQGGDVVDIGFREWPWSNLERR